MFALVYKIISRGLQASILGNIEELKLLGPRRCFVEFGAGKGKLSHWVDVALKDAEGVHFLLVEKAPTRFKVSGRRPARTCVRFPRTGLSPRGVLLWVLKTDSTGLFS